MGRLRRQPGSLARHRAGRQPTPGVRHPQPGRRCTHTRRVARGSRRLGFDPTGPRWRDRERRGRATPRDLGGAPRGGTRTRHCSRDRRAGSNDVGVVFAGGQLRLAKPAGCDGSGADLQMDVRGLRGQITPLRRPKIPDDRIDPAGKPRGRTGAPAETTFRRRGAVALGAAPSHDARRVASLVQGNNHQARPGTFGPDSAPGSSGRTDGTEFAWEANLAYQSLEVASVSEGLAGPGFPSFEPNRGFIANRLAADRKHARLGHRARSGCIRAAELTPVGPGDFASAFPAVSFAGDFVPRIRTRGNHGGVSTTSWPGGRSCARSGHIAASSTKVAFRQGHRGKTLVQRGPRMGFAARRGATTANDHPGRLSPAASYRPRGFTPGDCQP